MGAAASASSVVTTALHGDVLVVTIDNPPVNALGAAVRQGLLAAMHQAQADAAVAAVLLVGAGKAFIAGADIREFGKPPVPPALPEVCRAIEGSDKPVVAVLHGAALGGGLEVALSAHYRLALPAATVGLPEVNLGLLPGSGGTQRAPRLMGVQAATSLMLLIRRELFMRPHRRHACRQSTSGPALACSPTSSCVLSPPRAAWPWFAPEPCCQSHASNRH